MIIHIMMTRSLGALQARTSSSGPFGLQLRPSRPSGAQAARPTQVSKKPSKIQSLVTLFVPEIGRGTLGVTEKEKDWSWSILVIG